MKSLKDFIIESTVEEAEETSKTFTLDFNGIEDSTDMVNTLKAKEGVTEDDENVLTFTVQKGTTPSYIEDLKKIVSDIRAQQKNHSDETYAQKTKKFDDAVKQIEEFAKKEEVEKEEPKKNEEE